MTGSPAEMEAGRRLLGMEGLRSEIQRGRDERLAGREPAPRMTTDELARELPLHDQIAYEQGLHPSVRAAREEAEHAAAIPDRRQHMIPHQTVPGAQLATTGVGRGQMDRWSGLMMGQFPERKPRARERPEGARAFYGRDEQTPEQMAAHRKERGLSGALLGTQDRSPAAVEQRAQRRKESETRRAGELADRRDARRERGIERGQQRAERRDFREDYRTGGPQYALMRAAGGEGMEGHLRQAMMFAQDPQVAAKAAEMLARIQQSDVEWERDAPERAGRLDALSGQAELSRAQARAADRPSPQEQQLAIGNVQAELEMIQNRLAMGGEDPGYTDTQRSQDLADARRLQERLQSMLRGEVQQPPPAAADAAAEEAEAPAPTPAEQLQASRLPEGRVEGEMDVFTGLPQIGDDQLQQIISQQLRVPLRDVGDVVHAGKQSKDHLRRHLRTIDPSISEADIERLHSMITIKRDTVPDMDRVRRATQNLPVLRSF